MIKLVKSSGKVMVELIGIHDGGRKLAIVSEEKKDCGEDSCR